MRIEYDLEFRNFGTETKVSLKSGTMFPVNSSRFMMFGFHFHHGLMMSDHKHRIFVYLSLDGFDQRPLGHTSLCVICVKNFVMKKIGYKIECTSVICGPNRKLLTHMKRVR